MAPRGSKILAGPGEAEGGAESKGVCVARRSELEPALHVFSYSWTSWPLLFTRRMLVVNAEAILLRLIGSQGSRQTPSPQQSLVPSPACSGSARVGVVPETCPSPGCLSQSQGSGTAGTCRQLQPVTGAAQQQGAETECISQGRLNLKTLLKAWGPWCD